VPHVHGSPSYPDLRRSGDRMPYDHHDEPTDEHRRTESPEDRGHLRRNPPTNVERRRPERHAMTSQREHPADSAKPQTPLTRKSQRVTTATAGYERVQHHARPLRRLLRFRLVPLQTALDSHVVIEHAKRVLV
jgi:hypothetical protein